MSCVVPIEGDAPIRVEATEEYVVGVLGTKWVDQPACKEAFASAVRQISLRLEYCAGVDADGHRVYRLG
jgi:hypothetical protein